MTCIQLPEIFVEPFIRDNFKGDVLLDDIPSDLPSPEEWARMTEAKIDREEAQATKTEDDYSKGVKEKST